MKLESNADQSFEGSKLIGTGFLLTGEQAEALMTKDSRNRDVIFPILGGTDIRDGWDQPPSRWVIDFRDWPIERAREYPDCFEIIERLVKPERTRLKPDGSFQLRYPLYERWRHYGEKRPAL